MPSLTAIANPRPPRAFFRRDPITLARALLGQRLVRALSTDDGRTIRLAGLIVEVEAYLGVEDRAAHTFGGRRTARNESMWGDGGYAYVYFTYGMHHCLNVVAETAGEPTAVLLRALEPTEGIEVMQDQRPAARRETDLASGPGKLCRALGIDRGLDRADLIGGEALWIERVQKNTLPRARIGVGPRVGVGYAGPWAERPLRFFLRGNPHVSRAR